MEKNMETTIILIGYILGVIYKQYQDNGKENRNYYLEFNV